MAPAKGVTSAEDLRRNLAFEVHYMVHASIRFRTIGGKDKVIFQDSALMHARNLLEFTKPTPPRFGWWIADMGGPTPSANPNFRSWTTFINAKVTHLGRGRLARPPWPVPENDQRLVALSTYVLKRILDVLPPGDRSPRVLAMRTVAKAGVEYLSRPTESNLATLAELVDK